MSDRPGVSPPMWPVCPLRVSEPISSTLSGLFGTPFFLGIAVGRSVPRPEVTSMEEMLPFRCR